MATPDGPEINDWFLAIMKLWEGQNDSAVKISGACSFRLTMEVAFGIPTDHPVESGLMVWLREGLSVLLPISDSTSFTFFASDELCFLGIGRKILLVL
jgi:hypothetical protein